MVPFSKLQVWYYTDAAPRQQVQLALERRVQSFEEVVGSLSERDARYEAQRCLSRGNCFECDGCLGACPWEAVIKLGKGNRYRFDCDRCAGCAVCFEQCPCHAIEMTFDAHRLWSHMTQPTWAKCVLQASRRSHSTPANRAARSANTPTTSCATAC